MQLPSGARSLETFLCQELKVAHFRVFSVGNNNLHGSTLSGFFSCWPSTALCACFVRPLLVKADSPAVCAKSVAPVSFYLEFQILGL